MSSFHCLPEVLETLVLLQPRSVLDVGAGFGKYGMLLREFLEVWHGRYTRDDWQVTVDMVEAHGPYVSPWHHMFYDRIFVEDATVVVPTLRDYDAVLCVDVVEHLPVSQVVPFLGDLAAAGRLVVVTTPVIARTQGAFLGNEHERHRTQVTTAMLRHAGAGPIRTVAGTRIAYITREAGLRRQLFGMRARLGRALRASLADHPRVNALVHAVTGKRVWVPPPLER